jgi:hypothetical protein
MPAFADGPAGVQCRARLYGLTIEENSMGWTRNAPKTEGYYWYLPCMVKSGEWIAEGPPTVIYLNSYGYWAFAGNQEHVNPVDLDGVWWEEMLTPPEFDLDSIRRENEALQVKLMMERATSRRNRDHE